MVTRGVVALAAVAAALAAAACFEKITAPPCVEAPWTIASAQADTITTSAGWRFIPGDTGAGNSSVWCETVAVHYDGYLLDGTLFDSSRPDARALIFTPGLGSLIDGFEQGVIGMKSCQTRRLIIPPSLAYGDQPVRDEDGDIIVPANSTVIFDVEMLEMFGEPVVVCDSLGA